MPHKMKRKENVWNIANLITALRLLLGIPLIYYVYIGHRTPGIALYILFLAMDFADGRVARWLKCETLLGKNLDIITDGVVGTELIAVLILQGVITPAYMWFSALPVLMSIIGFSWGVVIAKKTFTPSKWRKLNGAAYFLIILAFLINNKYTVWAAYVFMTYYYVSWTKYLIEIRKRSAA